MAAIAEKSGVPVSHRFGTSSEAGSTLYGSKFSRCVQFFFQDVPDD